MKDAASSTPPRVLVVEDDPSVTRMLRYSLRAAGFEVAEAASGGEALLVLERGPLDAVVLDLGLPDGQGGAVLERLQQLAGRANGLPVWVVVSVLNREEARRRYGPLGSHFLAKPFDPWELVGILKGLLFPRAGSAACSP